MSSVNRHIILSAAARELGISMDNIEQYIVLLRVRNDDITCKTCPIADDCGRHQLGLLAFPGDPLEMANLMERGTEHVDMLVMMGSDDGSAEH